jgi:hypothetical protein
VKAHVDCLRSAQHDAQVGNSDGTDVATDNGRDGLRVPVVAQIINSV